MTTDSVFPHSFDDYEPAMFGRLRLRRVVISMLLLRCFYLILSDDEEEHYYLAEATNSSSRDEFFGEKIPKVILQLREKVKAIEKEMEMKNKALAYRYKIKKGRGVKIFDGKDEEEAKQGSIA